MTKKPMKVKTERGFELIKFKDRYGALCSLQQSSLAESSLAEFEPPGTSAVWLGTEVSRMHLDVKQVEWLVDELNHWLKKGKFSDA